MRKIYGILILSILTLCLVTGVCLGCFDSVYAGDTYNIVLNEESVSNSETNSQFQGKRVFGGKTFYYAKNDGQVVTSFKANTEKSYNIAKDLALDAGGLHTEKTYALEAYLFVGFTGALQDTQVRLFKSYINNGWEGYAPLVRWKIDGQIGSLNGKIIKATLLFKDAVFENTSSNSPLGDVNAVSFYSVANDAKILISDIAIVETTKTTSSFEVVDDIVPDLEAPQYTINENLIINQGESADLRLKSINETIYSGKLYIYKKNELKNVISFTDQNAGAELSSVVISGSGSFTLKYVVADAYGNESEKTTTVVLRGKPIIDTSNISKAVMKGDSLNLKPEIFITMGELSDYNVKFTVGKDEINVSTEEDWNYTFSDAGKVTVTYVLEHKTDSAYTASSEYEVKVLNEDIINLSEEGYQGERDIATDYIGKRRFGDVEYYYSFTPSGANFRFWATAQDAWENGKNLTNIDYMNSAIVFYAYIDYSGDVSDAQLHIGTRADVYMADTATYACWFISDYVKESKGKLVRFVLRIDDAVRKKESSNPDQFVYDNVNMVKMYVAGVSNSTMLISDFIVETTTENTGVYVVDEEFSPDLINPSITASVIGGDYKESVDLTPEITKDGYTGKIKVSLNILVGDKLFRSITAEGSLGSDTFNALLQENFSEFLFPTGNTYSLVYSVSDLYGNCSAYNTSVVITGKAEDKIPPEIYAESLSSEVKRGEIVDLTVIEVSDNIDVIVDIEIEYSVSYGDESVEVVNGKFSAQKVGIYRVTITATDKAGNSVTVERDINVTKSSGEAPVIEVPTNLSLTYTDQGQVNLSGITAKDSNGNKIDVSFTVTAPDGRVVEVGNKKFTFDYGAGEYKVTIYAIDGDLNDATKVITITATSTREPGGCGGNATNCLFGILMTIGVSVFFFGKIR